MIQPRLLREEVVGDVVDRVVLDHEHALGDRLLDHALPDLIAGERDDERGHADERHDRALERADQRACADRERDREQARELVRAARQRQLGDDDARDAADVADREVDLADQEHEDDAVGEHRHAGHLRDDVGEVARGEEVVGLEREEEDDQRQADQDGPAAEVAGADIARGSRWTMPSSGPPEVGGRRGLLTGLLGRRSSGFPRPSWARRR